MTRRRTIAVLPQRRQAIIVLPRRGFYWRALPLSWCSRSWRGPCGRCGPALGKRACDRPWQTLAQEMIGTAVARDEGVGAGEVLLLDAVMVCVSAMSLLHHCQQHLESLQWQSAGQILPAPRKMAIAAQRSKVSGTTAASVRGQLQQLVRLPCLRFLECKRGSTKRSALRTRLAQRFLAPTAAPRPTACGSLVAPIGHRRLRRITQAGLLHRSGSSL
mmetsp:Transcript_47115/g.108911  ORF Transcript_47115/g.108911 Transcript_47115/m.108911 type:complete len:217 (+) Transcript_47115:262-912(+)